VVQAALVVVDEHRRGDVHRVDQAQALANTTFRQGGGYVTGDVHETAPLRDLEPELFAEGLHGQLIDDRVSGSRLVSSWDSL
jgi:hypothetical protein